MMMCNFRDGVKMEADETREKSLVGEKLLV